MFDIGWQELFIVGLLALIVVGPKDLPRVLRTVTGMMRKVKGMAREFQNGLDDVVRESELDDMRKEMTAQGQEMSKGIVDQVDPNGDLTGDLDLAKEQLELNSSISTTPEIPDPEPVTVTEDDTVKKDG